MSYYQIHKKEFIPNGSWLKRLKQRSRINFKRQHGEENSADFASAAFYVENTWPQVSSGYIADQIYSFGESALSYKLVYNRTLTLKNDNSKGVKKLKIK